jgi:hypothetical protein
MVQKEVADRILAGPGEKAYGALTVGRPGPGRGRATLHGGAQRLPARPGVESTVIRIRPRPRPSTGPGTGEPSGTLTRAAFGMRRKQLQKILRTAPGYRLDAEEAERSSPSSASDPRTGPRPWIPRPSSAWPPPSSDSGTHERHPPGVRPGRHRPRRPRPRRLWWRGSGSAEGPPGGPTLEDADTAPRAAHGRDAFFNLVSHELRSPIAAIIGYQELLRDGAYGSWATAPPSPSTASAAPRTTSSTSSMASWTWPVQTPGPSPRPRDRDPWPRSWTALPQLPRTRQGAALRHSVDMDQAPRDPSDPERLNAPSDLLRLRRQAPRRGSRRAPRPSARTAASPSASRGTPPGRQGCPTTPILRTGIRLAIVAGTARLLGASSPRPGGPATRGPNSSPCAIRPTPLTPPAAA